MLQIHPDILKAYEVSADQLAIDALIVTLYQKDMRIRQIAEDAMKMAEEQEEIEVRRKG